MKHQNPDLGKSEQNAFGPVNFKNSATSYIQLHMTSIDTIRLILFRISGQIGGFRRSRSFTVAATDIDCGMWLQNCLILIVSPPHLIFH